MEFSDTLLYYFKETYPNHSASIVGMIEFELTPLCQTYGVIAVRKALKEAGVERVPQLTKDFKGSYLPRAFTVEVNIDGQPARAYMKIAARLHEHYPNLHLVGLYNYMDRDALNFYPDPSTGNIYSSWDWIEYGAECVECGTPFIGGHNPTTCPSCRAANEPHSYSTRAEDVLGEIESKEVRFGIELEYEGVTAKEVKNTLFKHAIAKRDGSITSGVEVVTLPAPMKLHKEKLKKFFQDVITQAADNTGMHVHIERSKLSEYQVGFILEFLNKESLYPKLEKIAGRNFKENHYCKQKPEMNMTWGLSYEDKLFRVGTDKYSTLNTSKGKTIEVRIFSSPESHLECSAKLEFIEGLVAFSSPYAVNVKSLKDKFQWDTFDAFMTANKKHYPSFYAYYQGVI